MQSSPLCSRFWDVTQCSPKETAAHNWTTFLSWNKPITASVPFSRTFSHQIRPLKLAQSENVFYMYLCIPAMLEWALFAAEDSSKFTLITRSFQLEKIIVKREDIYFNLPNKETKKWSSFARFVDSEFWMLLFSPVFNL